MRDVLVEYSNVFVTIHATLFVFEAEGMHQLMLNLADEGDAFLEVDCLLNLRPSDVGAASRA